MKTNKRTLLYYSLYLHSQDSNSKASIREQHF